MSIFARRDHDHSWSVPQSSGAAWPEVSEELDEIDDEVFARAILEGRRREYTTVDA